MINDWTALQTLLARIAACLCVLSLGSFAYSQDDEETAESATLPVPGQLIDFDRDVKPIFVAQCLSCHGPEDDKAGFRIDDEDTVLAYVEAGDLESSSLWADYLVTDDPDLRMPPAKDASSQPGLSASDLAVIKLWIEEGAKWAPWDTQIDAVLDEPLPAESMADQPLASRMWVFQGLFHPASVHFPIALLAISGVFVFFSLFRKDTFQPAAFHCLWIGALAAVASCVMGWAYAVHEGYGTGFGFDLTKSAIDRHRWLGIAVAVGGVLMVPVARMAIKKDSIKGRLAWLFGGLVLVAGVSITGYQGGELIYGEDHYEKEFNRLFPEYADSAEVASDGEALEASLDSADTAKGGATEGGAGELSNSETSAEATDSTAPPAEEPGEADDKSGDEAGAKAEDLKEVEASVETPPGGEPGGDPEKEPREDPDANK